MTRVVFGFRIPITLKQWMVSEARRRNVTVQVLAGTMLKQAQVSLETFAELKAGAPMPKMHHAPRRAKHG